MIPHLIPLLHKHLQSSFIFIPHFNYRMDIYNGIGTLNVYIRLLSNLISIIVLYILNRLKLYHKNIINTTVTKMLSEHENCYGNKHDNNKLIADFIKQKKFSTSIINVYRLIGICLHAVIVYNHYILFTLI